MPAFYAEPQTIDDLINQAVGRTLDIFGLDWARVKRWGRDVGPVGE